MSVVESEALFCEPSREVTSTHHPNGMLDRDQRTAKSLPEFSKMGNGMYTTTPKRDQLMSNKCCYKSLLDSPANAIKPCKPHQLPQNDSVLLIYQCSNNNNVQNGRDRAKSDCKVNNLFYCQLSSKSSCKHAARSATKRLSLMDCDRLRRQNQQQPHQEQKLELQTSKSHKSKALASSYPASCSKFSKLSNLLICICFWLLILQKTRAMPVSPSCDTYKDAIKMILDQAKMSYKDNLGAFDSFTKKYFQQSHDTLHRNWLHVQIDSLKPSTITTRKQEPRFYDKTEDEVIAHLQNGVFSKTVVNQELQELYERLLILEHAFNYITDESNVIDDYDRKYYETHLNYLRMLKEETGDGLEKLNIARPTFREPNLNDQSKELRDYFVMREHLVILKYIIDAYEILRSTCPSEN